MINSLKIIQFSFSITMFCDKKFLIKKILVKKIIFVIFGTITGDCLALLSRLKEYKHFSTSYTIKIFEVKKL